MKYRMMEVYLQIFLWSHEKMICQRQTFFDWTKNTFSTDWNKHRQHWSVDQEEIGRKRELGNINQTLKMIHLKSSTEREQFIKTSFYWMSRLESVSLIVNLCFFRPFKIILAYSNYLWRCIKIQGGVGRSFCIWRHTLYIYLS